MNRCTPTSERALILHYGQEQLVSILHQPKQAGKQAVLIIVGGPQYRAGGHRYFVTLARTLAENGYPVMRFDYRGMGDSDGHYPGFENLTGDIKTAIDALFESCPTIEAVALWGLCNAASASAFYGHQDPRVSHIIMLNPWAHDENAYDKVLLRHYYVRRLFDKGFWKNLTRGRVRLLDFPKLVWKIASRKLQNIFSRQPTDTASEQTSSLARHIVSSMKKFNGPIQLVLSGNDLTAKEFEQEVKPLKMWDEITARPHFSCLRIDDADHTFSDPRWSGVVTRNTLEWLNRNGSRQNL